MHQAKARGSVIARAVRFLRRLKDDSRKVLPDHLQHYLSDRISPTDWYPEKDLQELLRACIKLMIDTPEPVALEEMGRWTAREHYSEFFPDLRKQLHPQTLIQRIPAIWKDHHNTGRQRFIVDGPTSGRTVIEDYGAPSQVMCAVIGAYNTELLRLAGWGDAVVTSHECVLHGNDSCSWTFTWTKELPASVLSGVDAG